MNIKDFGKVKELVEILSKLDTALVSAKDMVIMYESDDNNYWCSLSEYRDGSGFKVDLTGCYVGIEMAKAAVTVIENKISEVKSELMKYAVTFSGG